MIKNCVNDLEKICNQKCNNMKILIHTNNVLHII